MEAPVQIGQIAFTSDDQLVVTFVSHIVPEALPRRGQPDISSNLRLNALFINPQTGQLRSTHEWPTTSERSRITPVAGGKFIVITPDKLILNSPEIKPLKDLALPVGQEALQGWWDVVPSPQGNYLLLWYDLLPPGAVRKLVLIDTEALRVVRAWTESRMGIIPLAPFDDGNVVAIDPGGTVGTPWSDIIGPPPDGPWRPDQAPWGPCRPDRFEILINNETIFGAATIMVPKYRWCYTLARTTGELLFTKQLGDKEHMGEAGLSLAISAGGQRFATALYKGKGGSELLDIAPHWSVSRIMLYDIPRRQWTYTIDGNKQRIKSISGLALSPDGSLLALINQDAVLEVYRVPETPDSAGTSTTRSDTTTVQ